MNRIGTLVFLFSSMALSLQAQNVRTYTGWGNNETNPSWGTTEAPLIERTTPSFGNGYSSPNGQNRENARRISNFLLAQPNPLPSELIFSDYVWVFGQLMDHEFALVLNNPQDPFPIVVNFADPQFNPGGALPGVTIPLSRSKVIPGTGQDVGNPRQYANDISAYIDASMIYGRDSSFALWLRSFEDGKMKVSNGNLLPFNTINGEIEGDLDPTAPKMDNANPFNKKLFVAGDFRVNENVFLTAMHTLFVREHNWQATRLKEIHSDWNDEQLYQHARRITTGIIAAIFYEEWLPTLGVQVPAYQGYNPNVNPGLFNLMSAAAFRLGHTFLSSNLPRRDNLGQFVPQGDILLRNAFFNPVEVLNSGGVDPMLKGMAHQMQQNFDHKVVNDVRNFLFGAPGSGGMDLAAINIQRGRERGVADFNTIRSEFGLPKYTNFLEMTGSESMEDLFNVAYGNVDNVDAWVGLISEAKVPGTTFGPTLHAIMSEQFANMRDGDRFYYEVDPDLSAEEKEMIKNTRIYDVVMRNTNVTVMQKNLFIMERHEDMCEATTMEANINGSAIADSDGQPLPDVNLTLEVAYKNPFFADSDDSGAFAFTNLQTCRTYNLKADLPDTYQNGISIADIILLRKHLVNTPALGSPYKLFAADVNQSGDVTISDLIDVRKLLLGVKQEFEGTQPWRFYNDDYTFLTPAEPFAEEHDAAHLKIKTLVADDQFAVRGIKMGDLNGSAQHGLVTSDVRNADPLVFGVNDSPVYTGQTFKVTFQSKNIQDFEGFQMTLSYATDKAKLIAITQEDLPLQENINYLHFPEKGLVNLLVDWSESLTYGSKIFTLEFEALKKGNVSDLLRLSNQLLAKEAVTTTADIADIQLQFIKDLVITNAPSPFLVFGNQPNPFRDETIISFDLPEGGDVELIVYDLNGRQLLRRNQYFHNGYNQLAVNQQELGATGILIYQLNCAHGSVSDRMIITN